MQTMPNKTRTAVTLSAVLVVAVLVIYWVWAGTQGRHVTPPESPNSALVGENPEDGATAPAAAIPDNSTLAGTTDPYTGATGENVLTAAPPVPEMYVVQTGDTLGAIAQEYYGDSKYFGAIEAANAKLLGGRPDYLTPGMKLDIPRPTDVLPAATSPANSSVPSGN